jgi:hypothetical protein
MEWKKIGKALLFPPVWVQLLLTLVSAAALIAVFINGWQETLPAYLIYVLSFYTLSVVTLFCVRVLPKRYRDIKKKMHDIPLVHHYLTDQYFRTEVSLYASLAANLLYAAMNVISFVLYQSWWFLCLAVYYAILSVMRFLLVRYVRLNELGANRRGELKRALACSAVMLLLNVALTGAVLMMLYQNRGYEYSGILIYVMALYTFYITTHAIINMIRYRKFESPVMSTAKGISMAAALVSMLNLETAMFASFGAEMAWEDQQLMLILTGAGVAAAVIAISSITIVRSANELKQR